MFSYLYYLSYSNLRGFHLLMLRFLVGVSRRLCNIEYLTSLSSEMLKCTQYHHKNKKHSHGKIDRSE